MSAAWGHVAGVITVILMLCFVGIWVWAWLPRHRQTFDALAQLPMDDDLGGGEPRGDETR